MFSLTTLNLHINFSKILLPNSEYSSSTKTKQQDIDKLVDLENLERNCKIN